MSNYLGEREASFVRVPVYLKRQAELCAIIQGLTINEWIIKCIEQGLAERGGPKMAKRIPEALTLLDNDSLSSLVVDDELGFLILTARAGSTTITVALEQAQVLRLRGRIDKFFRENTK